MEKMQAEGTLEGAAEYIWHMDLVAKDEAVFKWSDLISNDKGELEEEMEGGEADMDEG